MSNSALTNGIILNYAQMEKRRLVHKLVESNVSNEANNAELASKLWILSEEICGSFGFITFNI